MTIQKLMKPTTEMLSEHTQYFNTLKTVSDRVQFSEEVIRYYRIDPDENVECFRLEKDNDTCNKHKESAKSNQSMKSYRAAVANVNTGVCFGRTSDVISEAYAVRAEIFYELRVNEATLESLSLAQAQGGYSKKTEQRISIMSAVAERRLEEEEAKGPLPLRPTQIPHVPKLHFGPHPKVPFLDGCLELVYSIEYGRHVISNKQMGAGKILAIDEAICPTMTVEGRRLRCSTCFQENMFSLIPCESCTSALFCDSECYEIAMSSFHKYECPIIDFLYNNPDYRNVVRMCINTFKTPADIEDYIAFTTNADIHLFNVFNIDWSNPPHNYRAKLIYTLETNDTKRNLMDKFTVARQAAHLMLTLRTKTNIIKDLFPTEKLENFLREYFYHHLQVVSVNGRVQQNCSSIHFNGETQQQKTFAYAIHPFTSMINHSCKANVAIMGYGLNKLILYTVRPISKGQQLFLDYV